jgi:hypothetical protein
LVRQGAALTRWAVAGVLFAAVVLIDGVLMGKLVGELNKGGV